MHHNVQYKCISTFYSLFKAATSQLHGYLRLGQGGLKGLKHQLLRHADPYALCITPCIIWWVPHSLDEYATLT